MIMKTLLINGSPNAKGCIFTALTEVAGELERRGIETEIFHIGNEPIVGCQACRACKRTGQCIHKKDTVNTAIEKIREADALVIGSPVYYAGIAGQMKCFLDRVFFAGSGFANKPGASVVNCRRGGASSTFDQLNHYFTISNMPVVSSQYWNQTHGFTPEDVRQDLEGLQMMRTLAVNMAWLLKCIEAGRKTGVEPPVYEHPVVTSFIR